MFTSCSSLTGITLPSSITIIEGSAFYNSGLTSIDLTVATGLTTIGGYALTGTSLGGSIVFPSTVTTVGIQAFANTSISTLTLNEGLLEIGDSTIPVIGINFSKLYIPYWNSFYPVHRNVYWA